MTLPKLIEVDEELFDTDPLHDYEGAQTVFNVVRIARDFDSGLLVAVVDDIDVGSGALEEGRHLVVVDALGELGRGRRVLGHVAGEDVLRSIKVFAELKVVDLSSSAAVTVLPDDQVKHLLVRRHQAQTLEHSEELVRCDVQLLGAVEVHEAGLEKNAFSLYFVVHLGNCVHHHVLLLLSKDGVRLHVLNEG